MSNRTKLQQAFEAFLSVPVTVGSAMKMTDAIKRVETELAEAKAENARLKAATESRRVKQTQLDYLRAQLDLHKKELAEANADNARLAAGSRLMRIGVESVYAFLQNEGGVTHELEQAMQQRDYVTYLSDLLAPTIGLLEAVIRDDPHCSTRKIESELARLRGMVKP